METWRNRVKPAVNRVFDVLWEGLPELDSDAEEGPPQAAPCAESSTLLRFPSPYFILV